MNDQTQPGYSQPIFPFTRPHDFAVPPPAPLPPDNVLEALEEGYVPFNDYGVGGQLPPTFPQPYAPEAPYRPAYQPPPEEHHPASWPTQDTPQRVANANLRYIPQQPQPPLHRGPLTVQEPKQSGEGEAEVRKRGRKKGELVRDRWNPTRQRLERMSVGDCEAFMFDDEDAAWITQACNERWVKDCGKVFKSARGVFVQGFDVVSKLVLVTRTA